MRKVEFIKTVTRPYPPFYSSLIFEGYRDNEIWTSFLGFEYALKDLIIIEGLWYYPRYHMIDFAKELTERLFSDEQLFRRIKAETLQREEALSKADDSNFETFCAIYSRYMPALGIYFICDDLIEDRVKQLLAERYSSNEVETLMQTLTAPYEDNFIKKSQVEFAQSGDVDAYLSTYGWVHSRYGERREYPREEAEKLLHLLREGNFLEKYDKEKRDIGKTIEKAKSALAENDRYVIDVMQFFIYERTQRTDIMNRAAFHYAEKIEEVAHKKDITYEDILFCTHREINTTLPTKQIIEQRKKAHSFLGEDDTYSILIENDHKILKAKFGETAQDVMQFEGRIAYRGNVSGVVKIIRSVADSSKLNEGDILVTAMTTPEMVPIMKKAAAFITDEGGITCHAAIIAREMKKPCIIGTKIATKVLSDGDKIEVDAEKGIVRILKRNE